MVDVVETLQGLEGVDKVTNDEEKLIATLELKSGAFLTKEKIVEESNNNIRPKRMQVRGLRGYAFEDDDGKLRFKFGDNEAGFEAARDFEDLLKRIQDDWADGDTVIEINGEYETKKVTVGDIERTVLIVRPTAAWPKKDD